MTLCMLELLALMGEDGGLEELLGPLLGLGLN